MINLRPVFRCFALGFLVLVPLRAELPSLDPAAKTTQRFSTNRSMIGIRNTLLIYLFPDQKAALQVVIDNRAPEFPVTAVVFRFADDATKASLEKWLNNQHSDGLFMGAAKPVGRIAVPAESCRVAGHQFLGKKPFRKGVFGEYEVELKISECKQDGKFHLRAFTDKAKVAVPMVES